MDKDRIRAVAEGWTWKKIPRADTSKDCIGVICVFLFIVIIFIFYAIINGFLVPP
ncbi:MAG: hypothetical protein ACFFBJ_01530 [Promethearchaeota archaeon]